MYETSGTIGFKEIQEMLPKDMPHLTRNTIIIFVGFILLALRYPFGTLPFTLLLLLSAWPFVMRSVYIRKYMTINMQAIQQISNGQPEIHVTTTFGEQNVSMSLPNEVPPVVLEYKDLYKLVETDSLYCISTSAHKAVYVFKNQLPDKAAFFAYLRGLGTAIPEKQLQYKENN